MVTEKVKSALPMTDFKDFLSSAGTAITSFFGGFTTLLGMVNLNLLATSIGITLTILGGVAGIAVKYQEWKLNNFKIAAAERDAQKAN